MDTPQSFIKCSEIPSLKNAFNWVLKEGEIPNSWRDAYISVIPTEGKDKIIDHLISLTKTIDYSLLF